MTRRTRSPREFAELAGVSERHIHRLIDNGTIPVIRLGRRKLIPLSVVERLLAGDIMAPPVRADGGDAA
jgi:excisionase family DNA binding protein